MAVDLGAVYRATFTTVDNSGALADPSEVTLVVTYPDQTSDTLTYTGTDISRASIGSFYVDFTTDQEGLWKFAWSSTTPVNSITEYESVVAYRSIVSMADMKQYLHVTSTTQDSLLRDLMHDATELIEKHCGTLVTRTFTDDHIPGYYKSALRMPHGPIIDATSDITITTYWDGGPTWTQTEGGGFIVNPYAGVIELKSRISFWDGPWKATYIGGRKIIPGRLVLAAKIIIDDLWALHRETASDPLSPSYDEEMAMMERMPVGYEMPPQAWNLVKREKRPGFA